VVKQADLLAVPRPPGGRVLSTGDAFWPASAITSPRACRAAEGDCLAAVTTVDEHERTSTTDEHDLGARETIDLEFAPPRASSDGSPRLGVAVAARQTLVTTFLLYQGLAWLGGDVTTWLATVGQGAGGTRARHLLGGIEVQTLGDDGAWHTAGEIYETGPIAVDVHLVVLPEGARADRVRLRLPRGGWRIDAVMLAALGEPVAPIRIAPTTIRGTLSKDYGRGRTVATGFPIVTVPGDAYALTYALPARGDGARYELFLDSRGYYLEWMRAEWMHEQNPLAAMRMLADPDAMLRELAPRFKALEPHMEEIFWRSRYAHP
jgi:hypothetical protein